MREIDLIVDDVAVAAAFLLEMEGLNWGELLYEEGRTTATFQKRYEPHLLETLWALGTVSRELALYSPYGLGPPSVTVQLKASDPAVGSRILAGFRESVTGLVRFLEDMAVFLAVASVPLLIVMVPAGIFFVRVRKRKK
jgi:hypothetical protein